MRKCFLQINLELRKKRNSIVLNVHFATQRDFLPGDTATLAQANECPYTLPHLNKNDVVRKHREEKQAFLH